MVLPDASEGLELWEVGDAHTDAVALVDFVVLGEQLQRKGGGRLVEDGQDLPRAVHHPDGQKRLSLGMAQVQEVHLQRLLVGSAHLSRAVRVDNIPAVVCEAAQEAQEAPLDLPSYRLCHHPLAERSTVLFNVYLAGRLIIIVSSLLGSVQSAAPYRLLVVIIFKGCGDPCPTPVPSIHFSFRSLPLGKSFHLRHVLHIFVHTNIFIAVELSVRSVIPLHSLKEILSLVIAVCDLWTVCAIVFRSLVIKFILQLCLGWEIRDVRLRHDFSFVSYHTTPSSQQQLRTLLETCLSYTFGSQLLRQ
mmetsp:Transcript_10872/g.25826  ORF Transcript_10872/g.25826 Transcript_10872/m.25826 type:complete len:303 (-) Transcript_10872:80-988(-)